MAKATRGLTAAEVAQVVGDYHARTGTRAEYCAQSGITESALDYYLRRAKQGKIVPVEIVEPAGRYEVAIGLPNGRRVELRSLIDEAGLSRLLAVLEQK